MFTLSPKEIQDLAARGWLTDDDVYAILNTLLMYLEINEKQSDLLKQSIDELVSLRARVKFYRQSLGPKIV